MFPWTMLVCHLTVDAGALADERGCWKQEKKCAGKEKGWSL